MDPKETREREALEVAWDLPARREKLERTERKDITEREEREDLLDPEERMD